MDSIALALTYNLRLSLNVTIELLTFFCMGSSRFLSSVSILWLNYPRDFKFL